MMKVTVEFRNPVKGRYVVRTDTGLYTAFQLLSAGVVLEPGDDVIDELDDGGVHTAHA